MNLLIDIGNTNLHWARHDDGGLGPMQCLRHERGTPLDLLAAWEVLDRPGRVLVSNVAGETVAGAVARVVRAYWGLEAQFAVPSRECLGVRVAYPEPTRLGVDRWLALLAAHGRGPGSALILDAGTAATFDLLLADGQHLGGLILPGLNMMRNSLLTGTQIPRTEPEAAADPWATDTGAAVFTGSLHALAALAERTYDRLCELSTPAPGQPEVVPPTLLLTGGNGPQIRPLISRPLEEVPDLVLRGLARLATLGDETQPS